MIDSAKPVADAAICAARGDFDVDAKSHDVAAISVPAEVMVVKEVPVLSTGKTDFRGVVALVKEQEEKA